MQNNETEVDLDQFDLGFLEFSIFSHLNALIYSSLAYAADLDFGINREDEVFLCDLPDLIKSLLGLEIHGDGVLIEKKPDHILRLTPMEKPASDRSEHYQLWQRLFLDQRPDLALSFEISKSDPEMTWRMNGSWLVWDWKINLEERIDLTRRAYQRLEIIHSDPDWLEFAKAAVHGHPKLLAEKFIKRGGMPTQLLEELEQHNQS